MSPLNFKCKAVLTLALAAATVSIGTFAVSADGQTTTQTVMPPASAAVATSAASSTSGAANPTTQNVPAPTSSSTTSATASAVSSVSSASSTTSSAVPTASTAATTAATASSADPTAPVQILGVNDFHGYLDVTNTAHLPSETVKGAGTAALLAGYFDSETSSFAAANPDGVTLKVEAGDMVGASPATSNLLYDQPTMAVLNAMGIQVGTLGNHDFDKGLAFDNSVFLGKNPDPGASSLADQFYSEYTQQQLAGNFTMVVSNVIDNATGQPPYGYSPYSVLTQQTPEGTMKIGFIGVVTTTTPSISNPNNVAGYTFLDPATQIAKYDEILRSEGVDAIVVLGHTASDNASDGSVVGETADIITKLNQIDPNNDVSLYIAGHSHTYTDGVVGHTRVVQALSYGEAFDDITATYDFATNTFVDVPNATIIAVDPNQGVTPDSSVAAIVSNAEVLTSQLTAQPVGQLASGSSVSRSSNSLGESPLGDLVTYAQYETAKSDGIPVLAAMTNDGGIRTNLVEDSSGNVTWGAAQAVQPFGDTIEAVQLTGQQIEAVLNQQTFDSKVAGADQFYLQEYGIKYTVKPNPNVANDPSHPYIVATMTDENGTPISLTQTYDVVINDYIYAGGDGFTAFENAPLVSGFPQDTDTNFFTNYMKSLTASGQKIPVSFSAQKSLYTAPTTPPSETPGGGSDQGTKPATPKPETPGKTPENKVTIKDSQVSYQVTTSAHALPQTGDLSDEATILAGVTLLVFASTLATLKGRKKNRRA